VQNEEWFKNLPQGSRRFDLRRMMLSYRDKGATGRKEVKADVHIHYPNRDPFFCFFIGASTPVALAQHSS
jgi:hypothetical protein